MYCENTELTEDEYPVGIYPELMTNNAGDNITDIAAVPSATKDKISCHTEEECSRLEYSRERGAAYCSVCHLFTTECGTMGNIHKHEF